MAKSDRLYKDSPTIKRDEETGKPAASRGARETAETGDGVDGMEMHMQHSSERREMKHRHVKEHLDMHHRHEIEHAHHKDGHKGALHERHESELAEMHKRHHGEMKSMHDRHEKEHGGGYGKSGSGEAKKPGTGEEKIDKIEKTEKED